MSNLRNRVAVPLGILLALVMVTTIYLLENMEIQFLVFSIYLGLVTPPHQFYEVAWLLATLDQVLNLTLLSSLLLWCGLTVGSVLLHRQLGSAVKTMATAVLIPGGAWILFVIKFAPIGQFHPLLLWAFIIWRFIVPVTLFLGGTGLLSIPFWLLSRQRAEAVKRSYLVRYVCSQCGTKYRSNPIQCVQCGSKESIHKEF